MPKLEAPPCKCSWSSLLRLSESLTSGLRVRGIESIKSIIRCHRAHLFLTVSADLFLRWRSNSRRAAGCGMDYRRDLRASLERFQCEPLRMPLWATVAAMSSCAFWRGYTFGNRGESLGDDEWLVVSMRFSMGSISTTLSSQPAL